MTYRLPPLNGLRAFEAAARHLSFKHAAIELCVTAGAVSQQVKGLETSLGTPLFKRLPRGLVLTSEGETYLESISEAFDVISSATDQISKSLKGRRYRLGLSSSLSEEFRNQIKALQDSGEVGLIVEVSEENHLNFLQVGDLDVMLRSRVKSHPGLHLDQLPFQHSSGNIENVTLVLMPGNKGCWERQLLMKALAKFCFNDYRAT